MATIVGSLSFTGQDALGVPTNYNQDFSFDDAKTAAQIATFANDAFDHFTPTSDAGWTGIAVTLYPVTNNPTSIGADSIAERTGLFNFSQATGRFKYGVDVESIAESLIVNGKIDLSATEISNWIDYLVAAHSGFTLLSKAAQALVALIDALISFRKKRKLESRRSFEVPS
jgi:hypothetical protein